MTNEFNRRGVPPLLPRKGADAEHQGKCESDRDALLPETEMDAIPSDQLEKAKIGIWSRILISRCIDAGAMPNPTRDSFADLQSVISDIASRPGCVTLLIECVEAVENVLRTGEGTPVQAIMEAETRYNLVASLSAQKAASAAEDIPEADFPLAGSNEVNLCRADARYRKSSHLTHYGVGFVAIVMAVAFLGYLKPPISKLTSVLCFNDERGAELNTPRSAAFSTGPVTVFFWASLNTPPSGNYFTEVVFYKSPPKGELQLALCDRTCEDADNHLESTVYAPFAPDALILISTTTHCREYVREAVQSVGEGRLKKLANVDEVAEAIRSGSLTRLDSEVAITTVAIRR